MMKRSEGATLFVALMFTVVAAACGAGDDAAETPEDTPANAQAQPDQPETMDVAELARQIGPIEVIELGPIEAELAAQGAEVFTSLCSACHKLDERYVGPPLRDVTDRRPPEFVMNMILNPEGMLRDHPEVKALLAQYYTPMPNQNLTEDEARAVLEYLRAAAAEGAPGGETAE